MSKTSRNRINSDDSKSTNSLRSVAAGGDEQPRDVSLQSLISGYREEDFPQLRLDHEKVLRIFDLVDPAFRHFIDTEESATTLIHRLKGLHIAAYVEKLREPRSWRSNVNLRAVQKDLKRFINTLDAIERAFGLFDATSTLFDDVIHQTSRHAPHAPRRHFRQTFHELEPSIDYLQALTIKADWFTNLLASRTPDEQEDFFFGGKSEIERKARQLLFSFAIKGRRVSPQTFIARQIASVYRLTTKTHVSHSRTKADYSGRARGQRAKETDRQFYDGEALRFACVLIRELNLREFMDLDLIADTSFPFPWENNAEQNVNPWEKVKNKIGRIWEDDEKRSDKDMVVSWAPAGPNATSKKNRKN